MKEGITKKTIGDAYVNRVNFLRLMKNESDENHKLSYMDICARYKRPKAHGTDGSLLSYGIAPSRNTVLAFLDEFGEVIIKSRTDSYGNSTGKVYYFYSPEDNEISEEELSVVICGINALQCIDDDTKSKIIGKLLDDKNDYFRTTCGDLYGTKCKPCEASYTDVDFNVLRTVVTALKENRRVQFNYFRYTYDKQKVRSSGKDVFEVEPACLHIDSGYLYLIAYKAGIKDRPERIYRVDRIGKIWLTDKIDQPRRINEKQFRKEVFHMYSSGDEKTVVLECKEDLANSMIDKFGDFELLSHANNKFVLRTSVKVSNTFYGWLAMFGNGIKLLGPDDEAEKYKKYLENILEQYRD